MDKIIKTCGCCGTRYTRESFERLEFIGIMELARLKRKLELRLCSCGSSIAVTTFRKAD